MKTLTALDETYRIVGRLYIGRRRYNKLTVNRLWFTSLVGISQYKQSSYPVRIWNPGMQECKGFKTRVLRCKSSPVARSKL